MGREIFLLLILAHFIGDFVLQGDNTSRRRKSEYRYERIEGNILHAMVHLCGAEAVVLLRNLLFGTTFENPHEIMKIIFLVVIAHFIVDMIKSEITTAWGGKYFMKIFLVDQITHILIIILICRDYLNHVDGNGLIDKITRLGNSLTLNERYILCAMVFVLCTFAAAVVLRIYFMRKLGERENDDESVGENAQKEGNLIGILERSLIILSITTSRPELIGFVITAKSIARFKKLDKGKYNDFFIIGTLWSFIIGIGGGMLIDYLLK